MPTFFQALGRIIQGKPVYTANDQPPPNAPPDPMGPLSSPIADPFQTNEASEPTEPGAAASTESSPENEEPAILINDPSTFPIAYVKRTMTRLNGEDMQVYAYIVNNAGVPIDLHKIHILGREEELKHFMRPGDDREFLIYEGPLVNGTDDHEAVLIYKTESGQYFEAVHDIRFTFNQTAHAYCVDELRLRSPIRILHSMI